MNYFQQREQITNSLTILDFQNLHSPEEMPISQEPKAPVGPHRPLIDVTTALSIVS